MLDQQNKTVSLQDFKFRLPYYILYWNTSAHAVENIQK